MLGIKPCARQVFYSTISPALRQLLLLGLGKDNRVAQNFLLKVYWARNIFKAIAQWVEFTFHRVNLNSIFASHMVSLLSLSADLEAPGHHFAWFATKNKTGCGEEIRMVAEPRIKK